MRTISKLSLSVALAAGLLTGAVLTSSATAGADPSIPAGAIVVGTASATCSAPDYTTIQAAINAASSGATIYVCAGTYHESLTIDKPLTLDGAQYGIDARNRITPHEAVIDGSAGIVYGSGATTGTLRGFTLSGYSGGVGEIDASNVGSGWTFTDDIMDVSNGGIYVNTDGIANPATSTIADNNFIQSTPSWAPSGDFGQAVLLWGNSANNVSIANNDFVNLSGPGAAINTTGAGHCVDPGTDPGDFSSNLSITGNSFTDNGASFTDPNYGPGFIDENFLALFCTSAATISDNSVTITDANDTNAVTPIYMGGGDWATSVTGNTLTGNGASGASGVQLNSNFYAPGTGVAISENTISGFYYGIHVTGSNFGGNFNAPTAFTVSGNAISASLQNGIKINPGADNGDSPSGGTITDNDSRGSATIDCLDSTTGSGTLGTANTWSSTNVGATSTPSGLCAVTVVVTSPDVVPYPTAPTTGQFVAINQGGTSDGSGVSVVSAGPPGSLGSLQLTTTTSASHWSAYNEDHGGTPLANITALSYSTYSNDAGNTLDPGLQLVINPGNTSAPDAGVTYSTLNFEPYVQAGGQTANTWQTWNVMSGVVWGTHLTGAPQSAPISWSTFVSRYPHATILSEASGGGIGVNVGSGWSAMTGGVGELTFGTSAGTTRYVFDPTAPSTSTTTTPADSSIVYGSSTSDEATVTGDAVVGSPTGTVSFYACGPTPTPTSCTSTGDPVGGAVSVAVGPSNTSTATSISFTPPSAGQWCLSGRYSGDSNYASSSDTSTGECFSVTQATPSTPTISNVPGSGTFGGSSPTLTVSTNGDGTKSVTSSTPSVCTVSGLVAHYVGVGTCTLTAHVGAGTDYVAADGSPQSFTVTQATPSTPTISNVPGSGTFGGSSPTLTVSTNGDGTKSVTSSTPSVCTVSGLVAHYVGVGTCTLTAHVGAGTDYVAADGSPQSFTVVKASTTTKSVLSNRTIYLGQAENDRATVTGNAGGGSPTGSFKFYECGLKSVPTRCTSTAHEVGGKVNAGVGGNHSSTATSAPFTPNAVGYWCFSAYYSGSTRYLASSDTAVTECVHVIRR